MTRRPCRPRTELGVGEPAPNAIRVRVGGWQGAGRVRSPGWSRVARSPMVTGSQGMAGRVSPRPTQAPTHRLNRDPSDDDGLDTSATQHGDEKATHATADLHDTHVARTTHVTTAPSALRQHARRTRSADASAIGRSTAARSAHRTRQPSTTRAITTRRDRDATLESNARAPRAAEHAETSAEGGQKEETRSYRLSRVCTTLGLAARAAWRR